MRQVSASNVEPFVKCTASHVLPQHQSYMAKTESGTDNHKLVGDAINNVIGGNARLRAALPGLADKLPSLLDGIGNPNAEAAYVVDVKARTSVFLGHNIGRDYAGKLGRELGDYELGVSLDVDGYTQNGAVPWIRDFKFGTYHSWWQLYVQAMAIMWLNNDWTEVDAGFYFVDVRDDDSVWVTENQETLYLLDIEERADEIMAAFDKARRFEDLLTTVTPIWPQRMPPSELPTVEGKWCQYCGAFPHCPSKWKLAKSLLDMDVIGSVAAMTLEQCGAAWKKLGMIEKNIIAKTKDALKERMRAEQGFPLEHGKKLAVIQMPGRASLDKPAVVALLLSKGVTQEEIQALTKQGAPYDQVREVLATKFRVEKTDV